MEKIRTGEYGIEKQCGVCEKSVEIKNMSACLCDIKGVVRFDGYCRRFKLDLIKLKPSRSRQIIRNDEYDFTV